MIDFVLIFCYTIIMNNVQYKGREAYFHIVGTNKYGFDIVEVDGIRFTLQCANGIDTHSIKSKNKDAKQGIKSYYVHDAKIRKNKKVIKYITIRLSKYLMARDMGSSYDEFIYNPKCEQIIHKDGDNWNFSVDNLELVKISTKIKRGKKDSVITKSYDKSKNKVVGIDSKGYDVICYNGLIFKVYSINRKTYNCKYYICKVKKKYPIIDKDGIMHEKDVFLHRYKFEKETGIIIPKNMVVHHIDGNSLNNNISNLTLMTRKAHSSYHGKLKKKRGDVI